MVQVAPLATVVRPWWVSTVSFLGDIILGDDLIVQIGVEAHIARIQVEEHCAGLIGCADKNILQNVIEGTGEGSAACSWLLNSRFKR